MLVCFLAVLFAACNDNKDDNKPSTYRVTFDTADGRPEITPKTVNSGERVQEPTVKPTKGDSVATGWINTATGQPYNFSTAVTTDLFLKAFYSLKTYKVGFDTAGGTPATIAPQSVKHGEKVQQPEVEPAKSDSVFNVWVNAATDQAYNFADPVTEGLNLRATYAALGITFNTEYLYNSEVERYHVVITKKGSGGAPDDVLENTVLSEGFYDTKSLRSQVADAGTINLNVKAYKKPTQNTATLTAAPYPGGDTFQDDDGNDIVSSPATVDDDGRILAATMDIDMKGRDLKQPLEIYFGDGTGTRKFNSLNKARSSLRMVWDFTPFHEFLQKQTPPTDMEHTVRIQRQAQDKSGWKLLIPLDIRTTGP